MGAQVKNCQCGSPAAVYAMDSCPGGWADYYCWDCKPPGWTVTDVFNRDEKEDGN